MRLFDDTGAAPLHPRLRIIGDRHAKIGPVREVAHLPAGIGWIEHGRRDPPRADLAVHRIVVIVLSRIVVTDDAVNIVPHSRCISMPIRGNLVEQMSSVAWSGEGGRHTETDVLEKL